MKNRLAHEYRFAHGRKSFETDKKHALFMIGHKRACNGGFCISDVLNLKRGLRGDRHRERSQMFTQKTAWKQEKRRGSGKERQGKTTVMGSVCATNGRRQENKIPPYISI